MPAEWEPHQSTWLTWPQTPEYWPDLETMESLYISMIRVLVRGENVDLLVNDQQKVNELSKRFKKEKLPQNKIRFHTIPTKDIWIRDYGPTFLTHTENKQLATCCWRFNVWGGKYDMPHEPKVASQINEILGSQNFGPDIVMEGGAIEVNGTGVCLTTTSCVLNSNRNPGRTKNEIENYLKIYLGVKKVVWCECKLEGDDTDGHIDNLARFVNRNTILCAYEDDPKDCNHQILKQSYETLKSATNLDGTPFNIIKLPMPGSILENSMRLPASYANFYIANVAILVPTFDHPNDAIALKTIQGYFPDREIVALPSNLLITGNGGPHCATQQQPFTQIIF